MGRSDPLLTYEGHQLVVMAIDLNEGKMHLSFIIPVSYTHLTLPTKLEV